MILNEEKPTKFFYLREQQQQQKKTIQKLKIKGTDSYRNKRYFANNSRIFQGSVHPKTS